MSDNSRWLRFFSLGVNLDKAAAMAAQGDRPEGYGLIVTTGAEERVVAHAVFELERSDRAEVAFAVADEMQGRGLATVLIAHLAQVASARGVRTFSATVRSRIVDKWAVTALVTCVLKPRPRRSRRV